MHIMLYYDFPSFTTCLCFFTFVLFPDVAKRVLFREQYLRHNCRSTVSMASKCCDFGFSQQRSLRRSFLQYTFGKGSSLLKLINLMFQLLLMLLVVLISIAASRWRMTKLGVEILKVKKSNKNPSFQKSRKFSTPLLRPLVLECSSCMHVLSPYPYFYRKG